MKQKKNVFIVWFAVMLFSQGLIGADLFFPGGITPTFSARGANIIVDDDGQRDYASIQSAINNAVEGDVLYVHAGTYNEHIVVNKALTIIGNGSSDTIVSGGGNRGRPEGNCQLGEHYRPPVNKQRIKLQ